LLDPSTPFALFVTWNVLVSQKAGKLRSGRVFRGGDLIVRMSMRLPWVIGGIKFLFSVSSV
ncbi:MAG TPA: hypothetical protein VLL52_09310, partial [Anaerolineae bacterium]|nr:hypothetical protein [Anaerolineae bacterium]